MENFIKEKMPRLKAKIAKKINNYRLRKKLRCKRELADIVEPEGDNDISYTTISDDSSNQE